MGVGGDVGFDEGGIAAALASIVDSTFKRPVFKDSTVSKVYNKKGLVIEERTRSYDVSMGEVLIPLVLMGFVTLTPLLLSALRDAFPSGTPPGEDVSGNCNLGVAMNLYGNILGPVVYANCIKRKKQALAGV